ncbi:MAG TPA: tripartite tricarboxylate transporter substrate-binding protein [Azospirillaceae bacterium]|nr:tripartite tricarboxylate transporter substrate-binding protein [Azospirillaceae bacterium]
MQLKTLARTAVRSALTRAAAGTMMVAALGTVLAAGSAWAQQYPTRAVTMVVPFAAGGPTDTVARLVAQSMSQTLGQQVIIENVGGAGGTLGAARVAQASPDGYTLLLHHIGQATSATLYRKLPYNVLTDFAPVGLITDVPMTIVAKKDFPANSLQELIAYVKANKDKVTMANAGVGAASHLCGMLFQSAIETPLNTVPYRGTGPAMNDLAAGHVDLMCDQTTNTTGQIQSGAIKAYAVTTATRVPSLPNLPTTKEAGLPAVEVGVWHGLYAPKGTPPAIVDKLAGALQTALKDPTVKQRFNELGTEPVALERATPAALKAFVEAEVVRWRPIIQSANAYAD